MLERLQEELARRPDVEGITIIDAMDITDPLGSVIKTMIRGGPLTLDALANLLGLTRDEARQLGDLMVTKGLLTATVSESNDDVTYQIRFALPRKRPFPKRLLESFDDD